MGYSISISPKSKKSKEKMLRFFGDYFLSWDKVFQKEVNPEFYPYGDGYSDLRDDLFYEENKNHIGFDYSPSDYITSYYYESVLKWIVFKIGSRISFKEVDRKVPYWIYDGIEKNPILEDEENIVKFKRYLEKHFVIFYGDYGLCYADYRKIVKAQLGRLDKEWDKYGYNGRKKTN